MKLIALSLVLSLAVAAAIPLALAQDSTARLIDGLGADDFNARKAAEKAILDLGKKAIPALTKAAKEHEDAHVRKECVRLIAKIRKATGGEKPLAEPEKPAPRAGAMHGRAFTDGRSIEYRRDTDGRVSVKITEDGETREYGAESLEELKKTHPEVHALVTKHFGSFRVRTFGRDWPGFPGWPEFPEFPGRGERSTPREVPLREREVPGGFRMGIWIGEMSEALRVHLKLPKGEGVLVEAVVKGSLAGRIGVKRLDVIRKVNGTVVGSAAAVRAVVEKISEGGKVTLEAVRTGDPLTLVGTR